MSAPRATRASEPGSSRQGCACLCKDFPEPDLIFDDLWMLKSRKRSKFTATASSLHFRSYSGNRPGRNSNVGIIKKRIWDLWGKHFLWSNKSSPMAIQQHKHVPLPECARFYPLSRGCVIRDSIGHGLFCSPRRIPSKTNFLLLRENTAPSTQAGWWGRIGGECVLWVRTEELVCEHSVHLGEIAKHFSRNLWAVLRDIKAVCLARILNVLPCFLPPLSIFFLN